MTIFRSESVIFASLLTKNQYRRPDPAQLVALALLGDHPAVSIIDMGFPADWEKRTFWNK